MLMNGMVTMLMTDYYILWIQAPMCCSYRLPSNVAGQQALHCGRLCLQLPHSETDIVFGTEGNAKVPVWLRVPEK
jgi:hypothetical protein